MKFRIGFPVDAGSAELSFIVLVRLLLAKAHSCKGGRTSGLRNNSGAAFVFIRASQDISLRYRFEFEPVPMPNDKARPDNLVDVGYSDAAACALSIANYSSNKVDASLPLILISCAFVPSEPAKQLSGLLLEKVTCGDDAKARASLENKWHAALKNKAKALFLHEQDAILLCQDAQIDKLELSPKIWSALEQRDVPVVVSCKPHQLPLLATALGLSNSLFKESKYFFSVRWFFLFCCCLFLFFYGFTHAPINKQHSYKKQKVENKSSSKKTPKKEAGKHKKIKSFIEKYASAVSGVDAYNKGSWRSQANKDIKPLKLKQKDVPLILPLLQERDWRKKIVAIYLLEKIGNKSAIPALLKAMPGNYALCQSIIYALEAIKVSAPTVIEAIANDKNKTLRYFLSKMLARSQPGILQKPSLLSLASFLKGNNSELKVATVKVLRKAAPHISIAIPTLIKALDDRLEIRFIAAETLVKVGKPGIPHLISALTNKKYTNKLLTLILQVTSISTKLVAEKDIKLL